VFTRRTSRFNTKEPAGTMCVLRVILTIYRIHWLVFPVEERCVLCEVRSGYSWSVH